MKSFAFRCTARARLPASTKTSSPGFVTVDGNVWGRPVGVTVAKDGSLLVTDDGSNSIWRVSYQGK